MSDGEDEEDMLDIYFDKLAKEEDLSSRQQRSGSNKIKNKKTPINATNKVKSYDNVNNFKKIQ
ncbi:hypothetical protein H5410_005070 [Solanum commersonii]|uniref:Uncharacterized protein n=1 Tax=Solanum commersonii TaxID=4109 RepID=A0A9J6A6K8_SOLCO|nr:hypothetical protein H5410_005070 [Solanum commersonii]